MRLRGLIGRRKRIDRPAFLIGVSEIVNHFAPIWDAFDGAEFDILVHGEVEPPTLKSHWNARVRHTSDVLSAGEEYDALVSNYPISARSRLFKPALIKRLARRNIRMMYAAGKTAWNMSDWNSLYDGALCFGPHHAKALKDAFGLPVVEMGYPRFDRFFTHPPDLPVLRQRFGCDPERPVIVWLPTWKALSSVGHFNAEIAELTSDYSVVVKVHPLMPADEPERVDALRDLGLAKLITDATDNMPLYQLADFMLFDYGGPPFAGIYTDKRFVLLNVPQSQDDAFTGKDSSDLRLREDFANVDPGTGGIRSILADDHYWEEHARRAEAVRSEYFAPNYGTSSAVAADAILDRSWMG